MGKKKDYDKKAEGQQYEEILERQQHIRREGDGDYEISIEKSKQKDREELEQLGDEVLKKFRESKIAGRQDDQ